MNSVYVFQPGRNIEAEVLAMDPCTPPSREAYRGVLSMRISSAGIGSVVVHPSREGRALLALCLARVHTTTTPSRRNHAYGLFWTHRMHGLLPGAVIHVLGPGVAA